MNFAETDGSVESWADESPETTTLIARHWACPRGGPFVYGYTNRATGDGSQMEETKMSTSEPIIYVGGSTVSELMNELAELPEDMTVMLADTNSTAIGIGFDRVATVTDNSGAPHEVALFHLVNQEWFDKLKAKTAASKLPKLDSTRHMNAANAGK
jgi:hypothetical protein